MRKRGEGSLQLLTCCRLESKIAAYEKEVAEQKDANKLLSRSK